MNYSNYGAPSTGIRSTRGGCAACWSSPARSSGWAKRKSGGGRGLGIAAHRSFNTYVASVVEVEVDARGTVKVPAVHMAVDAGVIVNPDRVRVADGRGRR